MTEKFRVKVDGLVVAGASGPGSLMEAARYADLYREEGDVIIQAKIDGRWKNQLHLAKKGTDR